MTKSTDKEFGAPPPGGDGDAWTALTSQYPEIAEAISGSVERVLARAGLDEKTKQLVYIAAQTAVCYPLAVKYHVPLALKAGATKDEIVGAAAISPAHLQPAPKAALLTCISERFSAKRTRRIPSVPRHKVLLLGLGFWGEQWLKTLLRSPNCEMVGVSAGRALTMRNLPKIRDSPRAGHPRLQGGDRRFGRRHRRDHAADRSPPGRGNPFSGQRHARDD